MLLSKTDSQAIALKDAWLLLGQLRQPPNISNWPKGVLITAKAFLLKMPCPASSLALRLTSHGQPSLFLLLWLTPTTTTMAEGRLLNDS